MDNHGGDDIQIQGVGFHGVDMRLVAILREFGLERSLPGLLSHGINDLEALDEKRDEILNSSERYLEVNDHFQFIRLTEALKVPKLTHLQWFNAPQSIVTAGEKLQTFSAAGDEGVSDRVKLQERRENDQRIRDVLLRDLEPIQGRSLVDFPDYVIHEPGRYKVRVVSLNSDRIQTEWQDITVGPKAATTNHFPLQPPREFIKSSPSTSPTEFIDPDSPAFRIRPIPNRDTPRPTHRADFDSDQKDSDEENGLKFPTAGRATSMNRRKVDRNTQSEEKITRNVGTMPDPVQTRNFGNEVQPISSSTQTTTPIEQNEPAKVPSSSTPPREIPQIHDEKPKPTKSIGTSPPRHEREFNEQDKLTPKVRYYEAERHISDDEMIEEEQYICYVPYRALYHSRAQTPTPYVKRSQSPLRNRPPSAPPTSNRRRMRSQETDTSLDSTFGRKDAASQYDTPSKRDRGTTPTLRTTTIQRTGRQAILVNGHPKTSTIDRTRPYYYRTTDKEATLRRTNGNLTSHPSPMTQRRRERSLSPSYLLEIDEPSYMHDLEANSYVQEFYDDDEDFPARSVHDRSTMADLMVKFDHYTQYDPQTFMADRYVQTTPLNNQYDEQEKRIYIEDAEDLEQLPGNISIRYRPPEILQPATLPRRNQLTNGRKHDGIDLTGESLEAPIHLARQEVLKPKPYSPLLNIGTEHIIYQSPMNEMATPFESPYYYESSEPSSTLSRTLVRNGRSSTGKNSRPTLFPYETNDESQVRHSRNNGNFYLSSPPIRTINSSFQLNVTRDN